MSLLRCLPALALVVLATGCVPVSTKPVAAAAPVSAPVATAPGADDRLTALAWMQSSIEYRLVAGQTWRSALPQLDRAIKTPTWDALPKEDRGDIAAIGLPPAVIVDIDSTVLDVTGGDADGVINGRPFDSAAWNQWAQQAAATAIPGALEFTRAAASRGVTVFYVTNRAPELAATTLDNLRKLGFPLADEHQLLTRGMSFEACQEAADNKNCRRHEIGKTHRVLLMFGDSLGDFVTIPVNSTEGRDQAVRPYLAWVGERWFALPNPVYGGWLKSLEGNDPTLPEADKRARLRTALHR